MVSDGPDAAGVFRRDVCLIQVPYMIGDERHPASEGPKRFVEAGAVRRLEAGGRAVKLTEVERRAPFRDSASASLAVSKELAEIVREAVGNDRLPLVLAGSCDVSKGVLSGFDHSRGGVVWIDAHADFNTPESTISGFFAGMSLAVVTGHCYRSLWAQIGNSSPVQEEAIVLLGVRDLSPSEERARLERSAIQVVKWHQGRPQGDVLATLDGLAARVKDVYLHVDMDALDPRVAPGVVDHPVPGGLSLDDMEGIIHAVDTRFRISAATLATYNPDRDQDGMTLRAGLRLIEALARHP